MNITFDPKKDAANQVKHGLSLAVAAKLNWDEALSWVDSRIDSEERMVALLSLKGRTHVVVFVDRNDSRRIISLRKANRRECKIYETRK